MFQVRQDVYDESCEMNVHPAGPAVKFGPQLDRYLRILQKAAIVAGREKLC